MKASKRQKNYVWEQDELQGRRTEPVNLEFDAPSPRGGRRGRSASYKAQPSRRSGGGLRFAMGAGAVVIAVAAAGFFIVSSMVPGDPQTAPVAAAAVQNEIRAPQAPAAMQRAEIFESSASQPKPPAQAAPDFGSAFDAASAANDKAVEADRPKEAVRKAEAPTKDMPVSIAPPSAIEPSRAAPPPQTPRAIVNEALPLVPPSPPQRQPQPQPQFQPPPPQAETYKPGRNLGDLALFRLRAEEKIYQGDIAGARLLLAPGVKADDPEAVLLLAQTYDSAMLVRWKARGAMADAAKAEEYYAKARRLGAKMTQR